MIQAEIVAIGQLKFVRHNFSSINLYKRGRCHPRRFHPIARHVLQFHFIILYTVFLYSSLEETQFIDYRFVKDLELRQQPRFCCCCVGKELLIFADDKDSVSTRQTREAVTQSADLAPVSILHPEAQKAEAIVRNAWADTKLISD